MRIAHVDRNELSVSESVHGGAGHLLIKGLWGEEDFQTPWWFVHFAILPPGGGIGHHRHDECEEIYNHTNKETRFMNFCVANSGGGYDCTDFGEDRVGAPLEAIDRLPIGRLDRNLLRFIPNVHEGKGKVGVRQVWGHQDFRTNWGFVAHCVVPPGASVGYHRHDVIEETYIIMAGSGRMTVDDETEEVHVGDAIPNRLGGSHGIYNHTQEDLEMLVMAVCMEPGQFDTYDLGDDLTAR